MRLQNRLEGWWPLYDDAGLMTDYSRNSNNASVSSTITRGEAGILGESSYDFPGSEFITITEDSTGIVGSLVPGFTISAWINKPASDVGDTEFNVVFQNRTDDGSMKIGTLSGDIACESGEVSTTRVRTDYSGDTWYMITGVWNGSTLILYKNGVRADSTPLGSIDSGGAGCSIGGNWFGNDEYYTGRANDIRFYSRPLPPVEVNALYERGRSANYSSIKKTT